MPPSDESDMNYPGVVAVRFHRVAMAISLKAKVCEKLMMWRYLTAEPRFCAKPQMKESVYDECWR
jgi:hypothetical protein